MHSIFEILEESTDSGGPDLISLDDLKFALGIEGTDEDAELQAAITFQSRIISEYCDRHFGLAQALETFTFNFGELLPLRQALVLSLYPVVEVIEISAAGAIAADYELDPANGRLWAANGGYWATGPATIGIMYSGGYALPDEAPARLQQAVIQAVNEGRTTGSRDPSIREVQHGDTRIGYFTPQLSTASSGYLSAMVVDLIKPFRRVTVA